MTIKIAHLFPTHLGLNGEIGNVTALARRLEWAGQEVETVDINESEGLPRDTNFVFIGSGTVAGQLEALALIRPLRSQLETLSEKGVPILAVGAGWELLGRSLELVDGTKLETLGIFPSSSRHVSKRASCESFGFDFWGNLTAGYSNHSAEIELDAGISPLVRLSSGHGNSSTESAKTRSDEGLVAKNLFASRLNGPLLPINPDLADHIIGLGLLVMGMEISLRTEKSVLADEYARNAREGIQKRLSR
jgi:CobQ-like glutamine amidotransferase family enzyme